MIHAPKRPPRRAHRTCSGRFLKRAPLTLQRRALPRFVGRAFCVPVAFTGDSPRFLRGEPGISQKPLPLKSETPKGASPNSKACPTRESFGLASLFCELLRIL